MYRCADCSSIFMKYHSSSWLMVCFVLGTWVKYITTLRSECFRFLQEFIIFSKEQKKLRSKWLKFDLQFLNRNSEWSLHVFVWFMVSFVYFLCLFSRPPQPVTSMSSKSYSLNEELNFTTGNTSWDLNLQSMHCKFNNLASERPSHQIFLTHRKCDTSVGVQSYQRNFG